MHRTKVKVLEDVLDANGTLAAANRADFDRHAVTVVNFMSAPGAGKTTLLERGLASLRLLGSDVRAAVLEGDVQGSLDADRIASLHVPVTQINTDPGFGGECHLDANMVRSAMPSLPLADIDLLVIENVGNLVCPAEFRVGENHRVMVSSVTEGEDKPLEVPADVPRLRSRAREQDRPAAAPRLRPGEVPPSPRRGPSRRRAHARQRDARARGSTPGATGSSPRRAASGRLCDADDLDRQPARAPDGGQRPVLRRRGGADRAPLPGAGRALRRRRATAGARVDAAGSLGCASRRGRVRASGDRRQAGASGPRDRAPRPRVARRAERHGDRLRRPGRRTGRCSRARLRDDRVHAVGSGVGVRAAERRPVRAPGARRRRSTTCSGSSATSSSTTGPAAPPGRGRRRSCTRFWSSRPGTSRACSRTSAVPC